MPGRINIYVDDILTGGQVAKQADQCKSITVEIMEGGKFKLHKWNQTFLSHKTKPILRPATTSRTITAITRSSQASLIYWASNGTIVVEFPTTTRTTTKREVANCWENWRKCTIPRSGVSNYPARKANLSWHLRLEGCLWRTPKGVRQLPVTENLRQL